MIILLDHEYRQKKKHAIHRVSVGVRFGVLFFQVFSMTLRKADGAELGLNVKALDGQKVGPTPSPVTK